MSCRLSGQVGVTEFAVYLSEQAYLSHFFQLCDVICDGLSMSCVSIQDT